jgi:Gly-Xaa carboxypeptidase
MAIAPHSAVPGITEKGFLNVQLTVNTPGGHSSVPPQHTSIGMLSQLIVHYEQNPPSVSLARGTPLYGMVQCFTRASGLPKQLKSAIVASADDDAALQQVEDVVFEQPSFRALAGTTQAVDIIQGGIKANALPEEVYAVVNHRIDTSSTVAKVQAHIVANLQTVSEGFNLSVAAFGKRLTDEGVRTFGSLNISDAWHSALEPAPITPTDGKPYQLLAGTIKAVYAAHRAESLNGLADSNAAVGATQAQEVIVAPGMMSGNTDTRHYWALSKHILRYNHASGMGDSKEGVAGIHTVNESIVVDSFLEQVRFFATLILNADEADL